ncbi:hypothetical protein BDV93DRAFT_514138 [Ceratobasidium sp. AG-I]|nr:hypothetical protein BDV93DRAFT_514138 [Ceratobasidium sp. AG-I]
MRQFADTKAGRQKSQVDVQGFLDLSDDAYQTIWNRSQVDPWGRYDPEDQQAGVELSDPSGDLLFYKDHDYWPLECIVSKLFRNGASNAQAKQRAKAHLLRRWHRPERQAKASDSTEGPSARIAVSGDCQEHFRPGQTEASFD